MAQTNFERMIELANEVFSTKNDPNQLDVNDEVLARLHEIHPATVSEYDNGRGPVAWILLIPTTLDLMNRFLRSEITEKELFDLTPLDTNYEALYLCSAMVLEEYRRRGIAKRITLDAIERIRKNHPIKSLFVWAFTEEGNKGSEILSQLTGLPLFKKKEMVMDFEER